MTLKNQAPSDKKKKKLISMATKADHLPMDLDGLRPEDIASFMPAEPVHDPLHMDLGDLPPPPTPTLTRTETAAPEEEKPPKSNKRKRQKTSSNLSDDSEAEEKESRPRKSRVLMEQAEADKMIDAKGRVVLTPNEQGEYDAYKLRTFVVSLRKGVFKLGQQEAAPPDSLTLLIDNKEVTVPLHGRNAKRTPGVAKHNAFNILDKLRQHGVIKGRYVSVLRDFGFGGNSANSLVKTYTALGKGLEEAVNV